MYPMPTPHLHHYAHCNYLGRVHGGESNGFTILQYELADTDQRDLFRCVSDRFITPAWQIRPDGLLRRKYAGKYNRPISDGSDLPAYI